ncbi:MAG TPA: Uma2 family endonuclease [Blastocatellia bacterium]|nr:Uma2 family endonuclease [Blastocatellia bacterium]
MSLPDSPPRYTVAEYLALERSSEERYEFLDGQVYLMAGESAGHGTICTNISGQLYNQLRGKPCQVFSKDMKVRSGPEPKSRYEIKGLYSYADLVVVCGEPQFHDEYRDVLLNPTVIIEVLSPSTEAFDRGEKWLRYQTWLASLTHYVLVTQARPQLEHYLRQPTGEWLYSLVKEIESSLHLSAVDCTLRLAEVYDRIVFPVESAELPETEG